jgi:hypothetical protein
MVDRPSRPRRPRSSGHLLPSLLPSRTGREKRQVGLSEHRVDVVKTSVPSKRGRKVRPPFSARCLAPPRAGRPFRLGLFAAASHPFFLFACEG